MPEVTVTPETVLAVDDIALGDPDLWLRSDREGIFATLRRERPVSFHAEFEMPGLPAGPGFWSLTRHADVVQASRDNETFVSGRGTNIPDLPAEVNEIFGSMINMDEPRHGKLRRIVSRGFTPKVLARLEDTVRQRAVSIVDAVVERGECDFVTDVAAALPLQIICDMMGIPAADYTRVFDLTNAILGGTDPEYGGSVESMFAAGLELFQYGTELGQDRRDAPRDDLTSIMMQAELEGERLTAAELGSFFVLLVAAGNETTRNAISHGMRALSDNPDQQRAWIADFEGLAPTAIDEIVRWATPVIHFRRTAVRDTEVGGQLIAAGDKVVLWYSSANRDEAAFEDPYAFDISRTPNEHVGFGAGGPHFCLGAHLAKREMKLLFDELFRRLPDIHVSGEPQMLFSTFIHGIKHMPVAFSTPR